MKKIMSVVEVDGEGLSSLLGERVEIWCLNYIYTGKLAGINDQDVLLEDASVVYETGPLTSSDWQDAQKLLHPRYIRISAIESYAKAKTES